MYFFLLNLSYFCHFFPVFISLLQNSYNTNSQLTVMIIIMIIKLLYVSSYRSIIEHKLVLSLLYQSLLRLFQYIIVLLCIGEEHEMRNFSKRKDRIVKRNFLFTFNIWVKLSNYLSFFFRFSTISLTSKESLYLLPLPLSSTSFYSFFRFLNFWCFWQYSWINTNNCSLKRIIIKEEREGYS